MFGKVGEVMNSQLSGSLILLLLFSIAFIAVIAYIFVYKPRKPAETEGFISVPVAEGSVPTNCINSIPELASIIEKIKGAEGAQAQQAQESEDVREFAVLAGKLACMKTDLVSDAAMVRASANQPYVNTHDRQPITETLTQCFSKTMPPRDLELVFDLYLSRGVELIKRFGAFGLDCASAEGAYRKVVGGIYEIAKGRCLANPAAKKLIDVNGVPNGDFAAYELGGASL
jgi:hypothetical protein